MWSISTCGEEGYEQFAGNDSVHGQLDNETFCMIDYFDLYVLSLRNKLWSINGTKNNGCDL